MTPIVQTVMGKHLHVKYASQVTDSLAGTAVSATMLIATAVTDKLPHVKHVTVDILCKAEDA
jgi:hypothetical protein